MTETPLSNSIFAGSNSSSRQSRIDRRSLERPLSPSSVLTESTARPARPIVAPLRLPKRPDDDIQGIQDSPRMSAGVAALAALIAERSDSSAAVSSSRQVKVDELGKSRMRSGSCCPKCVEAQRYAQPAYDQGCSRSKDQNMCQGQTCQVNQHHNQQQYYTQSRPRAQQYPCCCCQGFPQGYPQGYPQGFPQSQAYVPQNYSHPCWSSCSFPQSRSHHTGHSSHCYRQ